MGRRFAAALALVGLLLLIAWAVYEVAFGPPRNGLPAASPVARASVPAEQKPEPAVAGADRIRVMSLVGRVERRAGGSGWNELRAGEALRQDDAIRTGRGGKVVLGLSGESTVEVSPRSEFTVAEISRRVAKVRMEAGRLSAVIREGSGRLGVEARGSDAAAESGRGAFSVLASGHGQLTVASTEGAVSVVSPHGTVVVNAGQQSIVRAGIAPSAPAAIPHSLFLKVGRPPKLQRERALTIAGRTAPGALVLVNGRPVEPAPDGRFSARVSLRDGRNAVRLEVEDAAGHRRVRRLPVVVKSKVRKVDARVSWTGGGDGS